MRVVGFNMTDSTKRKRARVFALKTYTVQTFYLLLTTLNHDGQEPTAHLLCPG